MKKQELLTFGTKMFNGASNLIKYFHTSICKLGHPIKTYSAICLTIIYLLNGNNIDNYIYTEYNTFKFDRDLKASLLNVQVKKEIKKEEEENLIDFVNHDLKDQLNLLIISEQNLCLEQALLDYKQDIRSHSFVLPEEEELENYKKEIKTGICNRLNLRESTYKLLLDQLFGKNFMIESEIKKKLLKNDLVQKEVKQKEESIKKEVEAEKNKAKKQEAKFVEKKELTGFDKLIEEVKTQMNDKDLVKLSKNGAVSELPKEDQIVIKRELKRLEDNEVKLNLRKPIGEIKAIFCIHGHGIGSSGFNDNGSSSKYLSDNNYNGISERSIIEKVLPQTCKELQEKVKSKGIIVHEIGKERTTLKNKIQIINQLSKLKKYTEHNAIGFALHYNHTSDLAKSGIEVYFSQQEITENGFFGPPLATNMLNSLKKVHNFGNHYLIKSDLNTRYKSLGILSETKPTIVLVEGGFLSNLEDTKFAISKVNEQKTALINGIVTFLK